MKKETKLALLIAGAALLLGGTIGFFMARRGRGKTSNFTGDYNSVFTIDNTTNQPQTVRLFNPFQIQSLPAGVTVNSVVNLQEFNKMLTTTPMRLNGIVVRAFNPATKAVQTMQPVYVDCKDSNGQSVSKPLQPLGSQYQFRDDITSIQVTDEIKRQVTGIGGGIDLDTGLAFGKFPMQVFKRRA